MKLRVGVVGLGSQWQVRHRAALLALRDRFDVRVICAEVAARAEQVACELGASTVDGFRALAARDDIDAVLVLNSEWYGPLPVLAACESGKAVYCATALDIEPQRAGEIKRRVEDSGVAFMSELPRRHAPATLRLKELIATTLGEPRLVFCHKRKELPQRSNSASVDRNGSPSVRDLMELVDWCRYVIGLDPSSVVGVAHLVHDDSVDYQMISLDFSPSGSVGAGPLSQINCDFYLQSAWQEAASFRPPAELQVCCENGVAFVDLPSTLIWFNDAGRHLESLGGERPVGEQMLMQFHRAVTSLVRKTSDLEDAYWALRIVLAAEESCRTGKRVTLEA